MDVYTLGIDIEDEFPDMDFDDVPANDHHDSDDDTVSDGSKNPYIDHSDDEENNKDGSYEMSISNTVDSLESMSIEDEEEKKKREEKEKKENMVRYFNALPDNELNDRLEYLFQKIEKNERPILTPLIKNKSVNVADTEKYNMAMIKIEEEYNKEMKAIGDGCIAIKSDKSRCGKDVSKNEMCKYHCNRDAKMCGIKKVNVERMRDTAMAKKMAAKKNVKKPDMPMWGENLMANVMIMEKNRKVMEEYNRNLQKDHEEIKMLMEIKDERFWNSI